MDFFASNKNAKCTAFFSQTYCPGTLGVDDFNHDWSVYGLGWIFVSPKMVLRTVSYLKKFKRQRTNFGTSMEDESFLSSSAQFKKYEKLAWSYGILRSWYCSTRS